MDNNRFVIEKLPDGRFRITSTGVFEGVIHKSADEFLKFMQDQLGGQWTTTKAKHEHHHHTHQHHHKH